MDTRVRIELDRERYECGSEVVGAIDIRTREPLCIGRIVLAVSKTMRLKIQKTEECREPGDGFEDIEKTEEGYRCEFEIYSNESPLEEISSGHHVFPFKFALRSSDGASSEVKGLYFDILCDIRSMYSLSAEIYMVGVHRPVYVVNREIQVVDSATEPRTFHTTVRVSSPICFFSKSHDVSFELDRPVYYSGESLVLRASVPQKSAIRHIECFVYEILNVSVDSREMVRTKYIVGGEARREADGTFKTVLRIPSTTPSTVTGADFSLRVVLFVNIGFRKGQPVRVKKYIHIVRRSMALCPEIESINILEGEVYPEKIFLLS